MGNIRNRKCDACGAELFIVNEEEDPLMKAITTTYICKNKKAKLYDYAKKKEYIGQCYQYGVETQYTDS